MQIEGSVGLVTGGASGLGAAAVRMLAAAGARGVVIVDWNEAAGKTLADELGPIAASVKADVSDPNQMHAAFNIAAERFGALHILANCAGIGDGARILGKEGPMALERFIRVIQVNLIGTFNSLRLGAALMDRNTPNAESEKGVIINTASIAAFDGQIGQCAYAASKGGIVGLTLPAARDLARHGIRVVTIAPGIFDTPLMQGVTDDFKKALEASVPFPPRFGRPSEYAQLARQIIENPMLNGEVIRLDGALRMAPR
jgi:NAD(P)-dependent dehydrogenase (short-subunit alcohol dehydrogenase family)